MKLKKKVMFILICILLLLVVFLIALFIKSNNNKEEKKYPKLDIYEATMECRNEDGIDNGSIYRYYIYNNDGDYYYVYVHEVITIKGSKEDIIERGDITSIDDFDNFDKNLKKHFNDDSRISYTYKVDDAYKTYDNVNGFKKCFGEIK